VTSPHGLRGVQEMTFLFISICQFVLPEIVLQQKYSFGKGPLGYVVSFLVGCVWYAVGFHVVACGFAMWLFFRDFPNLQQHGKAVSVFTPAPGPAPAKTPSLARAPSAGAPKSYAAAAAAPSRSQAQPKRASKKAD